jgi:hypothetical protein
VGHTARAMTRELDHYFGKKTHMTENSPSWKNLGLHQKMKYVLEIVAICGGLVLLGVNVYQVWLLSQSNQINRQIFNSTFPLEIQANLVGFVDENPLVIKLRLTNIVGRRMELHTLMPRFVRIGSEAIEHTLADITIDLFNEKGASSVSSTHGLDREIVLQPSESCILKLCSKLDVRGEYSEKAIFKPKPLQTAFIIIPIFILSFGGQSDSKIILLSLSRDNHKSLVVVSNVFRGLDDQTLMAIMKITRATLSLPEWD